MVTIAEIRNQQKSSYNQNGMSPAKPLRVAMCPPELEPMQRVMRGEAESATYIIQGYVAAGLLDRGYDVTYVAPTCDDRIVCTTDLEQERPAPRTWSQSGWFDFAGKAAWRTQRAVGVPYLNVFSNYRLYDACLQCLPGHDLVYERNGIHKYGVAKACKRLKLPYVLYLEADEVFEYDVMGESITGLQRWRAQEAMRYNLQAADCIICVSEPLKRHLATRWAVPTDKTVVFPNVADVQRFRPDPLASADVRASFGLGASPLVIFVGNFYEWHDVTTLLDAFAQASGAFPDAQLLLVGDGVRRQAMMQHAADLGIEQAVHFTGLVAHSEVPRLLAAADIAVVPYPPMESELWLSPLKLFEYMASGKAIIASAIGQLPDVIQDGCNGLLVEPGDVTAMASSLETLIGNEDLRRRLARQARQDAESKHSWERYLSRLESLFAAVIKGRPVNQI